MLMLLKNAFRKSTGYIVNETFRKYRMSHLPRSAFAYKGYSAGH